MFDSFLQAFVFGTIGRFLTYVLFAAPAFFLVWIAGKHFFGRWRLSERLAPATQIWNEVAHSLATIALWGVISLPAFYLIVTGKAPVYFDIHDHGWLYYGLTFAVWLALHDTYFYWTHRLMHHPRLFKHFHTVHHRSTNPSPWAIFSFDMSEAAVQFSVIYLLMPLMPVHISMYYVWSLWMLAFNVMGHLGHELLPRGFARSKLTKWWVTATHHSQHHKSARYNFGLYFTVWDKLMKTEHPRYVETFETAAAGRDEPERRLA